MEGAGLDFYGASSESTERHLSMMVPLTIAFSNFAIPPLVGGPGIEPGVAFRLNVRFVLEDGAPFWYGRKDLNLHGCYPIGA